MSSQPSTLVDYLSILRLRKWLLVCSVLVFVGGAWYMSSRQVRQYSATAQVLLSQADSGQTSGHTSSQDATRYDETQAQVAQTAAVTKMAVEHSGVDIEPSRLLASSSVAVDGGADILEFTVTNANLDVAVRLVNAYAKAFTVYRRTLDTNGVKAALAGLDKHLASVKDRFNAAQKAHTLQASQRAELDRLIRQDQNLRTELSLQTGGALFTKPATGGNQIQPKPVRDIVLGLFAGLGFGLILIALTEAVDTRVRTAEEVSQTLGLRLLARIPRPTRNHRAPGRMAVLQDEPGSSAEAFRQLRVAFDFANLDVHATTVLVTSATEGEGKSTTAANLAIALARTGRSVILADFDLRRPVLDRAFRQPRCDRRAHGSARRQRRAGAGRRRRHARPSGDPRRGYNLPGSAGRWPMRKSQRSARVAEGDAAARRALRAGGCRPHRRPADACRQRRGDPVRQGRRGHGGGARESPSSVATEGVSTHARRCARSRAGVRVRRLGPRGWIRVWQRLQLRYGRHGHRRAVRCSQAPPSGRGRRGQRRRVVV